MQSSTMPSDQLDIVPAPAFDEGDDEPPDPGHARTSRCRRPSGATASVVRLPSPRARHRARAAQTFRKKHFPDIPARLWNDWHWQLANRVRSLDRLATMLNLADEERAAGMGSGLPLSITPYYLSLLDPDNPAQPLRRSVVPTVRETLRSPGETDDPLDEGAMSPVPGLVHRYPDRVLLLLADCCSTYCRYCTRSRLVGHDALRPSGERLEQALAYIAARPAIRDVLLSGGDPLLLADDQLDRVLTRLRMIPHVEIIRIGTKVPAVLPQRITPALVRMLRRHHPLMMSLHFTHPDECTRETHRACTLLADGGIPLGSQTVLLAGINDEVETMRRLMHALLMMRVRPYYLYQCDPIPGSAHFRTPVERGLEILRGLRGHTSGYAVPTYVIDAPGGGGKIPLLPEAVAGRDTDGLVLRNYEGRLFRYPEPGGVECPQPDPILSASPGERACH